MKSCFPFPEVLSDGRNWRVRPGRGAANLEERILQVPTDTSAESRFIRTHELLHAEMTRGKVGEKALKLCVGVDCLNAVEDTRINRFLRDNVSDIEAIEGGGLTRQAASDLGRSIAASGSLRAVVLTLLASSSSSRLRSTLEGTIRSANKPLYEKGLSIAGKAERWLFARSSPSQGWGEVVAKRIEALLRGEGASAEAQGEAAQSILRALFGGHDESSESSELEFKLSGPARRLARMLRAGVQPENRWGTLEIARLPLVREQDGRLGRRWRAAMEGAGVRYLHRFSIDRAIFAARRRIRGGSILIDTSGSMHLSPSDVGALVRAASSATVAAYSGTGDRGFLWILAAGGKVADVEAWASKRCGGNIVDGPALRWLALQAKPRIWVSDGCVTGVGDSSAPNLVLESQRIAASAGIHQSKDVKAALRMLRVGGGGSYAHGL